jgi:hypothetical protein
MFGFLRRPSLEEKLAQLAGLGITLRDGMTIESLFREASKTDAEALRALLEKRGYELLLAELGGELCDPTSFEHRGWLSDDVWHFDGECINDHGDYKNIVDSLCRLSRGDLAFDEVRDFVDVENGTAWIDFSKEGETERLVLTVDHDWVDELIFKAMGRGLAAFGSPKQFAAHVLGQDVLIICKTPDEIRELNRALRLNFRSMS